VSVDRQRRPTAPAAIAETPTQLLHRLTSYEHGREWTEPVDDPRVVQDLTVNDLTRMPMPYKHYSADLDRLALPRHWPTPPVTATAALSGAVRPSGQPLDLAQLARLLFLSAGVTRTAERNGHRYLFRAAGSAGGRFPLELYVSVPAGAAAAHPTASGQDEAGQPLQPGLYWYDPAEHALVDLKLHGPAPDGDAPALIVTGVPWRTGWRYRERGYRHIYWDAGTMLAQFLALADSAGLPAQMFTRFPDRAIAALLGVDGVQEFPVAMVALAPGAPALLSTTAPVTGSHDADAVVFPLITTAQAAGNADALGAEVVRGADVAEPSIPKDTAEPAGRSLDDIVLRRGSVRLLDPSASLPKQSLVAMMSAAMRGVSVPHWVAVHAVDGLAAGLYRWPDLQAPVRTGLLRAELYHASLEQGLARDASFVAISAVELPELDDHQYREAQLMSGLVGGRLHLMAYALGAAASGMTFRDSDIASLLGTDAACLLWTCVGVPEYRSKPGGRPGTPAEIRMVTPRQ
jgi:SagB-type dehydrogenase family enzyme